MTAQRIVVFAYSDVGHACLRYLLERKEPVVYCHTYLDPEGAAYPPSVVALCRKAGVPFSCDTDWKNPYSVNEVRLQRPDLILSFYYRDLLPAEVLRLPRYGAFNMHGSLLPKYRGRAPINWAVLEGETEAGATLHAMTPKADAGDIVDSERVEIGPDETAFEVQRKVVEAAVAVLARQIDALKNGTVSRRPQDLARGFYRGRRRPEDGEIDWRKSARDVHNLVRSVSHPYPGAFTDALGGKTFLWRTRLPGLLAHDSFPGEVHVEDGHLYVACGDDRYVEVLSLQPDGGAETSAAQWIASQPVYPPESKTGGR